MAGEKILSIDDSPTVQRLIEMILSSQGYQVVLASDGEEGIAKAKAERPSVILVDFVMPKMNGFQVCKTLKDDPLFRDTPIILVTSKGDKVGSKFVDVLGIAEYFTKPFQPEDLLAKIREVIDRQRAAAPPPPPPPPPSAPPVQEAPRPASPAAPGGLEALIREVVGKALEEFTRTALPDIIRRELGKVQSVQNAGIRGNLATFRIIEVLQMLGLQRQTGRLIVTRTSDGGEIHFRDGEVVFATTSCGDGCSPFEGLLKRACRLPDQHLAAVLRTVERTGEAVDAVLARERLLDPKSFSDCLRRYTESEMFKIMAWREGSFVFEKVSPPAFAAPVRLKVEDLLLEGARRSDEWMLIQQKIPNFTLVFEPLIGEAAELSRRGMSDVDIKVFSLVDGRRTVQEIIDASCLSDFDVAKSLFILLSVNLVRPRK